MGRLLLDTRGYSTVEYLLILLLVAVVGVLAWGRFGESVRSAATGASRTLDGSEWSSKARVLSTSSAPAKGVGAVMLAPKRKSKPSGRGHPVADEAFRLGPGGSDASATEQKIRGFADGLLDAGENMVEEAIEVVKLLARIAFDPAYRYQVGSQIADAVRNPRGTWLVAQGTARALYDFGAQFLARADADCKGDNPYACQRAAGQVVGEIGSLFVPGVGWIGKTGRAAVAVTPARSRAGPALADAAAAVAGAADHAGKWTPKNEPTSAAGSQSNNRFERSEPDEVPSLGDSKPSRRLRDHPQRMGSGVERLLTSEAAASGPG